jgi:hypothetical protein
MRQPGALPHSTAFPTNSHEPDDRSGLFQMDTWGGGRGGRYVCMWMWVGVRVRVREGGALRLVKTKLAHATSFWYSYACACQCANQHAARGQAHSNHLAVVGRRHPPRNSIDQQQGTQLSPYCKCMQCMAWLTAWPRTYVVIRLEPAFRRTSTLAALMGRVLAATSTV